MPVKEKYIPVFKKILLELANLSTCQYRKVAAIVVKDNRIIAEGYNGTPSGVIHCNELHEYIHSMITGNISDIEHRLKQKYGTQKIEDIKRQIETRIFQKQIDIDKIDEFIKRELNYIHDHYEIHAEANAISIAAKYGIELNQTALFCTHLPCFNCSKLIIASGIKEVYYINDYTDKNTGQNSLEFLLQSGIKVQKI